MIHKSIDSHIHLDMYVERQQIEIISSLQGNKIEALISVSNDLQSAKVNLSQANNCEAVKPAFGFHPEQAVPTSTEIKQIFQFIEDNNERMVAIGEVGLPYYLKRQNPELRLGPYIKILEDFIILAKKYNKPIILHAIYEDASVVCDLLEKHAVTQAHFHWFKGNSEITERLALSGYYISITPDVLYEKEIMRIVECFPIEQMMVETDGPWKFTGPFKNQATHPKMIHDVINEIATIKQLDLSTVYTKILQNTVGFYSLNISCPG